MSRHERRIYQVHLMEEHGIAPYYIPK